MRYVLGTDVGGTFTDSVSIDEQGQLAFGKALSTPPDFTRGFLDSVAVIAESLGMSTDDLLERSSLILHGTTIAENAIITGQLAQAGLITTRGFEDTLYLMRGAYGRWSGLSEEQIKRPVMTDKPPSIIPRDLVVGVRERTDYNGEILARINETEVASAVQSLAGQGCQSLGVCFLWSFQNPESELKVRDVIRRLFPALPVTLSHELAPVLGEYERVSTVALNARLSPTVARYLERLGFVLRRRAFRGTLLVMQGYGGLLPVAEATARAVGTIESGPAAGVMGSQFLAEVVGTRNIIACDMGGTSFKVGVITEGTFDYAVESLILRYHYSIPKIDIASIGAGGGSIVWLEPRTNLPRVGPQSAGASPGPVCYDLGGEEPTITDVDLVMGYLDPDYFLGGRMKLNPEKAKRYLQTKLADPLGIDLLTAAAQSYTLVNSQMADLLHKVTVERGLDPRGYVLFAYGGAAPIHAAEFARELEVEKVVVPMTASVHGAFGAVSSDVSHEYIMTRQMTIPVDVDVVNAILEQLEVKAFTQLREEGFEDHQIKMHRSVTLKFRLQVYAMNTPITASGKLSQEDLEVTYRRFEELYEQKHGRGSAYREAGMEIVSFRVKASGTITKPAYPSYALEGPEPKSAMLGERAAVFGKHQVSTRFLSYDRLEPGNQIRGPSIILTPITTIVIPPENTAQMDAYRNVVIELRS